MSMVFTFVFAQNGLAQRTVSGTVTDENGESLPGVNVVIKGTATGVTTNLDGKYSISVTGDDVVLVFSSVGMSTEEITVGARTVIDVSMKADVTELSEVVVTALGVERNEKALGYAVQEVDSDDIINSGATSAVDALVGKAAGIQVTRSSGSAGGGSRILIRGVTSMVGDNQPLIVIDGVRTNNETLLSEASTAGTAQSNRLMDLNPEDIANVSILKGAAATALYGTSGASGVIVITTKKGKKNSRLNVTVNSMVSIDNVTQNIALQDEFAQGWAGTYSDPSTGSSTSWGPRISDLEYSTDPDHPDAPGASAFFADGSYKYDPNGFLVPAGTGNGTPANVYENVESFFQTAVSYTNSVSISGGSDVASFRFSASTHDGEGVIPNEEYDRRTVGIATNLQATDKLSFEATANYTRSDHVRVQQGSNTSGLLLGMYRTPSTFDNAGGFGEDAVNTPASYIFPDGAQRNYRGGGGYDNPYWTVNNTLRDETVHRVFGSFKVNYSINDWVNLSMNVGTDVTNDDRKQVFDINSRTAPAGRIVVDEFNTTITDTYLQVNGGGDLNSDFQLSYLAGMNLFSYDLHNAYVLGDGLIFQGFLDMSNVSSISSTEDDTEYKQMGFYGQVEGNWRQTLFLTLSARQDYDSRLGVPGNFLPSNVGFFYPSISSSFVFTELMPESDFLSFGKFRVSWAQVGAPPPFAYLTSTNYEISSVGDGWGDNNQWPILGQTSFDLDNTLGNPDLTPELTTTTEFGLDLRFLQGKVGLDVAYYTQKSEDAILNASLPVSAGFTSVWMNAGVMESQGVEITINATPVSTASGFSWDTQLNWSWSESIVKELAPGIERLFLAGFNSAGTYLVAGNQYGAIFGGAYLREDAGTDADRSLNIPGGSIVVIDDPTSSSYGYEAVDPTQRAIGNPNPDFILGWRNSFTYKRFTAGFLIDWREGGDMWNGTAWALSFFGRSELTAQTRVEAPAPIVGVKSDGTPNDIPIVRDHNYWTSAVGGFGSVGEQFVQDGGWIRLREVNLSYRLPASLFGQDFFKGGSVGFIGRNLWFDTPYDGIDPETSLTGTGNGQGFDYFNMPSTRSVIFKVSLNF